MPEYKRPVSPLPFGVLSVHHMWYDFAHLPRHKQESPLPFGILGAHHSMRMTWKRMLWNCCLHCLSAFTTLPEIQSDDADIWSPLPFGVRCVHRGPLLTIGEPELQVCTRFRACGQRPGAAPRPIGGGHRVC